MSDNTLTDNDMGFTKLFTTFESAKGEHAVFVGVLRSSGVYKPKPEIQAAKKAAKAKGEKFQHTAKTEGQGITIAQIAAINEFGSSDGKHPPSRPFMRLAIDKNRDKTNALVVKLAKMIVDGKMTPLRALGLLGETVKGNMVKIINSGVSPVNKKSTIDRKGSSKPLIDTGQLKNSIDWEIVKGK